MLKTGIFDKNGIEIFAGNKIKVDNYICDVFWEEDRARFSIKSIHSGDKITAGLNIKNQYKYEII